MTKQASMFTPADELAANETGAVASEGQTDKRCKR